MPLESLGMLLEGLLLKVQEVFFSYLTKSKAHHKFLYLKKFKGGSSNYTGPGTYRVVF